MAGLHKAYGSGCCDGRILLWYLLRCYSTARLVRVNSLDDLYMVILHPETKTLAGVSRSHLWQPSKLTFPAVRGQELALWLATPACCNHCSGVDVIRPW